MHQILFKCGPFQIYSYGLMLALAFFTATLLAARRAPSAGLKSSDIMDMCLWLMISGLAGARFLFILLNLDYYRENPIESLMLWRGGLVWYGGLITAFVTAVIFLRIKRISSLKTTDLMAPYVALGQAIGRIGCFLNGCCYGKPTSLPIGVVFETTKIAVHPTQLYESAAMMILFLVLVRRPAGQGRTFFLYLMMYSVIRFFIEFLRGDNPSVLLWFTVSQVISIAVFITASAAWKIISSK